MPEKTLREHLAEAGRARWAKKTPEERKEYSAMMNRIKNEKHPPKKQTGDVQRDTFTEKV